MIEKNKVVSFVGKGSNHDFYIFKDVETQSFSIECSCQGYKHNFSKQAVKTLEDDDKESILQFLEDLKDEKLQDFIAKEKQRFVEEKEELKKIDNPSIFYLKF